MRMTEKRIPVNGHELLLRNAEQTEAQLLLDYLKTVTAESPFLASNSDEIHFSIEDEQRYIQSQNQSEDSLLMVAFLDGEYIGNCSFARRPGSRRKAHRAEIGIALFQKYTNMGLGTIMLETLIGEIEKAGYLQVELAVIGGNQRAHHVYEKLGFVEYGRIPDAFRYDDGSFADEILMLKKLK